MAAKVYIVDYKSQADYCVYFVDYSSQEKNHQIIEGGKLVKYKSQADCKGVYCRLQISGRYMYPT